MSGDNLARALGLVEQATTALREISSGLQARNNPDRQAPPTNVSPPAPSTGIQTPSVMQPTGSRPSSMGVVSEVRRMFSPYPASAPHTPRRRRSAQPGGNPNSGHQQRATTWVSQRVFCLGTPEEDKVPSMHRKQVLNENQLGLSTITVDRYAEANILEEVIRREFPKLGTCTFELLRSFGGSGIGKPLTRISRTIAIPSPDALAINRTSTIFIRPSVPLCGEEVLSREDYAGEDGQQTSAHSCSTPMGSQISDCSTNTLNESSTGINDNLRTSETTVAEPNTPQAVLSSYSIQRSVSENEHQGGFPYSGDEEYRRFVRQAIGISDAKSISGYRQELYDQHIGIQEIVVSRDTFEESIFAIYKNPAFNFKKKPFVKFLGEAGYDVGALTREFFTLGMETLRKHVVQNRYPLLEGETDHMLPSSNPMLVRSGCFKFLGKFMAHSALHTGIAFVGLSMAAVRFLFEDSEESEKDPIMLSVLDIPDDNYRRTAQKMIDWAADKECSAETIEEVDLALESADIYVKPTNENIQLLAQKFMEWNILHSRAHHFNEIRDGMKSTGVFEFLQSRDYLWEEIFPREASNYYTAEDVIGLIRYTGNDFSLVKITMDEFLRSLDQCVLKDFVHCCTGWYALPIEGLEVKLTDEPFKIQSCFNQILVPFDMTPLELNSMLGLAVSQSHHGFGSY